MNKVTVEAFRVWRDEEDKLIALMDENGTDTVYQTKRATREFKDKLFTSEERI